MQLNKSFFGFCCLAYADPRHDYLGTDFRSTTLSWCNKTKPETVENKLLSIYSHNINEYVKVLNYCQLSGIKVYRISSSMFPLADHPDYSYIFEAFKNNSVWGLALLSTQKFLDWGGKLSTHPGQFVSITSRDPKTVKNSVAAINFHSEFMDLLGLPNNYSAHINIHLSNGSKCPLESKKIVIDAVQSLSSNARRRLTFENEDTGCWRVSQILNLFGGYFPIVFDSLHYKCNPDATMTFSDAFHASRLTWEACAPYTLQTVHHSESAPGPNFKKHSDFIQNIPDEFKNYPVFCEIEAKKKNLTIMDYKNRRIHLPV